MVLAIARLVVMTLVLFGSIIAIGASASLIASTSMGGEFYDGFEYLGVPGFYYVSSALAVATGVLTIVTLPIMMMLSQTRDGAFTSMIAVEFAWLTVLWILWLATGAEAAAELGGSANCYGDGCGRFQASEAFAFINWIALLGYTIALAVYASIHGNQWRSSVKDLSYTRTDGPGYNPNNSMNMTQRSTPANTHMTPAPGTAAV